MNDNPSGAMSSPGTVPGIAPQPAPTPQMYPGAQTPLTPANRPMEQAVPMELPKKKKKTGLIVGIIIAVLVLVGGGVAAAIVLSQLGKKDPVTMAMEKIMKGEAPTNVTIDGDINIAIGGQYSPVSNIKVSLDSDVMPDSFINNSKATVTATIRGVGDISVDVSEIYAKGDELFFKLDGMTNALEDSGLLYLLNMSNKITENMDCGEDGHCQAEEIAAEVNCEGDSDTNCGGQATVEMEGEVLQPGGQMVLDEDTMTYFASMVDAIEIIDGEWLRISLEDLGELGKGTLVQSKASCIANFVSTLNTNSSSATEAYSRNPFITATDKDVDLAKKQYTVYKIGIDNEKFANFVNSIQNTAISEKLYSCLGYEYNLGISADDAASLAAELPTIYAEVDNDNNFSRLYVKTHIAAFDDCACMDSIDVACDCPEPIDSEITMDLNFSYPDHINVPAPEEYRDFKDVIQDISASIYEVSY